MKSRYAALRACSRGLWAAAIFLLAPAAAAQNVVKPLPVVQTSGGALAGQELATGVKAWLGIPYVQAPVGALRWAPPQPKAWAGVWNADRKGPECMQVLRPHNINHYFGEEATSEDCLYMNIWAPPGSSAKSKLPVVVFIYGGGYTIGSSGIATYSGEAVANRGAVFVNFNYRVGLLGFMAHPELTREQGGHSGNYAFLDQNAALKWVKDNIARFGGDPERILISGQSAGAGSVVQQMFSPLSKGLFSAALTSSGCNFTAPDKPLADGEAVGLEAQKRLGVASLDDMRQVPADKIIALQAESQVGVNVPGLRAGPVVDGWFLPRTKAEIVAAGAMNNVPLIATFNTDEFPNALGSAKTPDEYREIAGKMYGDKVEQFLAFYPVPAAEDLRRTAALAAREAGLENNARNCARIQAARGVPTFISTYAHKHPYVPGVKIADQDTATVGAYHTADVPYWLGTLDAFNSLRQTRNWQPWDRQLSADMMGALIQFAKTGNPATAAVQWPAWSATAERKVQFGDDIRVVDLNVKALDFHNANPATPVVMGPPAPVRPRD